MIWVTGGYDLHRYILTMQKPDSIVKIRGVRKLQFSAVFVAVELKHWVCFTFRGTGNNTRDLGVEKDT